MRSYEVHRLPIVLIIPRGLYREKGKIYRPGKERISNLLGSKKEPKGKRRI